MEVGKQPKDTRQSIVDLLRVEIGEELFKAWWIDSHAAITEASANKVVITVSTQFAKKRWEESDHLVRGLKKSVVKALEQFPIEGIQLEVAREVLGGGGDNRECPISAPETRPVQRTSSRTFFPKMSLDSFIEDTGNKLGRAIAEEITRKPMMAVIHGPNGSGKSHLLAAAAKEIGSECLFFEIDTLAADFVNAARSQSNDLEARRFYARIRKGLPFILDGIDKLRGRPGTQNLVVEWVDRAIEKGLPFLASSEKPLGQLSLENSRLMSKLERFMWIEVSPLGPDGIRKVVGSRIANPEAISMIAHSGVSVRSAISIAETLRFMATTGHRPTTSDVEKLIAVHSGKQVVDMKRITEVVARHLGISTAAITKKGRSKDVALARQVVMYLASDEGVSNKEIANFFSKDHTTVLHAKKKVIDMCQTDLALKGDLDTIQKRIHQPG